MSTINNSYEYYESSQSLLTMLNSKKTGNKLINQIIADNEAAFKKTMESYGISSTSDSKYNKVSTSSSNLLDSIESLSNEQLYTAESGKEYDKSELLKGISNFVTAYNSEITNLNTCGGSLYSSFLSEFETSFTQNKDALEALGITISNDGKLTVDQDKLNAASVDDLKSIFGKDSTYMKLLSTSASSIGQIVDKALSYSSSNYTSSGTLLN
ncbi:MAG: hypothetical protein K6F66_02330 [Pseudobutyrivibrio sp.]|nr:hypothetical protein [Pseudobutyrivibrio sp.]